MTCPVQQKDESSLLEALGSLLSPGLSVTRRVGRACTAAVTTGPLQARPAPRAFVPADLVVSFPVDLWASPSCYFAAGSPSSVGDGAQALPGVCC